MHELAHSSDVIGVFDSGVGGLSVLRVMHAERPDVPLHYVADTAHAPYGERDPEHTIDRSMKISRYLVDAGAEVIVVACNTATACAIDALRERFPQTRFVGVEPGIKPAAEVSRTKRIGVMATGATLNSPRFRTLVKRHTEGCEVIEVACPGLASAIEQGDLGDAQVSVLLDALCPAFVSADVDTLVLGCTHYAFVTEALGARLGAGVLIIDTAGAVSRQAFSRWKPPLKCTLPQVAAIRLETTGDAALLSRLSATWIKGTHAARQVQI